MKNFAILASLLLGLATAQAQTSFVRQMAKDRSSLYIVVSGPDTKALGEQILKSVQSHRDWQSPRGKKASVLDVAQATELLNSHPESKNETFVVLLAGSEKPNLSDNAAKLLRVDPATLTDTVSRIHAQIVRPIKDGLSFSIVATAPDIERETRLVDEIYKVDSARADRLVLDKAYATNKLTIHVSGGVQLPKWGTIPGAWNMLTTCSLGDRTPESETDPEIQSVYLIDRSAPPSGLPQVVSSLAKSVGSDDNLLIAVRNILPNSRPVIILSAPNSTLLESLANQFPSPDKLPSTAYSQAALDLRDMGKVPLLVQRGLISRDLSNVIRGEIASDMRNGRLDVLEWLPAVTNADADVSLDQLLGTPEAVRSLKSKAGVRYLWYMSILDARGGTTYKSAQTRMSDVPTTFPGGDRPTKPDRHANESDAQRLIAIHKWEDDCDKWDHAHDDWQYRAKVDFEQKIIANTEARIRLSLKLIDLRDDSGKVVWELESNGIQTDSKDVRTELITVRGALTGPRAPRVPNSNNDCPDFFFSDAARDAGRKALDQFFQSVWLDGDPYGKQVESVPAQKDPVATAKEVSFTVTATSSVQAQISIGRNEGVAVGDQVIIDTDLGSVMMRVTEVGKLSVCRPISDDDKARFAHVKTGSTGRWTHS